MAKVTSDEHGTRGKRAELWAGYPSATAGAALELRDAEGALVLRTQGGPHLEATLGDRKVWSAP